MAISLTKVIDAPVGEVFALSTDFENLPSRIPSLIKVELLTPPPIGVGTRFRETRMMFKREATEEMEVTAFDLDRSCEISCRSCGALIRTIFRYEPDGAATLVHVDMTMKALSWFAWFMKPLSLLMMPMMKKCVAQDLEDLKRFAEGAKASGVA
jgi:uncharacterized membrane protein